MDNWDCLANINFYLKKKKKKKKNENDFPNNSPTASIKGMVKYLWMFHSAIDKVQVLLNHQSHWQVCAPLESMITWQSWHGADKVPHSYTAGIALCTSSTALDIPCTTEFSASHFENWKLGHWAPVQPQAVYIYIVWLAILETLETIFLSFSE